MLKKRILNSYLIIGLFLVLSTQMFVKESDATTRTYNDILTDRFTGEPIIGATVAFYLHTSNPETVTYLGQTTTNSIGLFRFQWTRDVDSWKVYLDFQHDDYLREYYEYDIVELIKLNHYGEGWTPAYTCTVNGLVLNLIDKAVVQLWGEDDHRAKILYGSTITNVNGVYEFTNFNFNKQYPEIWEVPKFYFVKIIKPGYKIEKLFLPEYPRPNDEVSLGTTTLVDSFPNGNFETGSLNHWTIDYGSPSIISTSWNVYEGDYACRLSNYYWFKYYPAEISQNVYIPFETLENDAITFWMKSKKQPFKVFIDYIDTNGNVGQKTFTFSTSSSYVKRTITKSEINLAEPYLPIIKITFSSKYYATSSAHSYIDAIKINRKVEVNGDFESGTLMGWETSSSYPAKIGTGYYVYSGTYGCCLVRYIGTTYYPTYIKQYVYLEVNRLASTGITFMIKSPGSKLRVTITYTDATTTTLPDFATTSVWTLKSILSSGLSSGKIISSIKFERLETSSSTTAIDNIVFHYT